MKGRMRLTESAFAKRCDILRRVDSPPAQIVRERAHKQIQNGLREYAKDAWRQNLIIQLHGFLWVRVFIAVQIIGSMDLTAAKALSAIHRIHPADNVIIVGRFIKQEGKMFAKIMYRLGMDFQQSGFNV